VAKNLPPVSFTGERFQKTEFHAVQNVIGDCSHHQYKTNFSMTTAFPGTARHARLESRPKLSVKHLSNGFRRPARHARLLGKTSEKRFSDGFM